MRQYEMAELSFHGAPPQGSFVDIDLKAVFRNGNIQKNVKGFYAGNGIYKVRFLPTESGTWEYRVSGMIEEEGCLQCEAADGQHHGAVRTKGLHFAYQDGTAYYPFGTTVYALVHQNRELVDQTFETLRQAPFNKIRFCMFPKHYDFNHNEPEYFAFERPEGKWDVNHPCFAFWDALEERIVMLADMGIEADLILFHPYDRWGLSQLSKKDSMTYLDYLCRRLSAYPNVWWSLANEYDLMDHYCMQDWQDFGVFLHENDASEHLLSNHNCFDYYDFTLPEVTHCCIQDINVNEVAELQRTYHKPVIFDECKYEGNIVHGWGNISGHEMTHKFWTACVMGGYCTHGETFYSDDEVLWWSRGGCLKGESPARIGFLRSIMESLPGPLDMVEDGLGSMSLEKVRRMKRDGLSEEEKQDFFSRGLVTMPDSRIQAFYVRHRACLGHFKDLAYLRYFEKECTVRGEMELPEDQEYTVTVIDTWEMTQKTVLEHARGKIAVDLPGKEGMALLAIRNEKSNPIVE